MNGRQLAGIALVTSLVCSAALIGCAGRPADAGTAVAPAASSGQTAPGPAIADPAKREACFANERTVETQASAWIAQNPGTKPPASVQDMVSSGALQAPPTCPSGGSYGYDPASGRFSCSVHGHF